MASAKENIPTLLTLILLTLTISISLVEAVENESAEPIFINTFLTGLSPKTSLSNVTFYASLIGIAGSVNLGQIPTGEKN